MSRLHLASPTVLLLFGLLVGPARAGEEPSPGPEWHRTWAKAKAEALETGRPIFAYFTKKH